MWQGFKFGMGFMLAGLLLYTGYQFLTEYQRCARAIDTGMTIPAMAKPYCDWVETVHRPA